MFKSYKRWLLYHLFNQKILLILVILGMTTVTLSSTFIPLLIGDVINNVVSIKDVYNLIVMLIIIIILYVFRNGMDYVSMMLGHFLGLKIELNMRKEFFDSIQSKTLNYYDNVRSGDLQALATNDLRVINTMISHGSFYIYPFIQVAIALFLLGDVLDLRIGLISIPFLILYIYFIIKYRTKLSPYAAAWMKRHSDLAVALQDNITGSSVVRAFTAEDHERNKFLRLVRAFRDNWIGENKVQSRFYPMLTLYIAIGTISLMSAIFVYQGTLSIGSLVAANLLITSLIDPTNTLFWATTDMMSGFAACSRLYNALSKGESEEMANRLKGWSKKFKGQIKFENVSFAYGNENNDHHVILKDLSFTIEPHQQVALVGPTGCGKTTLVKLILNLYKPLQGKILLDNIDIQDYSLEVLRKHIGYVEQDVYLFPRSIKENIAFGKPFASDEEIIEAAKLAHVDDFVQLYPMKYDTIVGERGTQLSGGEKQRIAIARALLTNPEVIILDDSVSAVDSETEEKIRRSIENVLKNRTSIIITHRLHAIKSADKTLVLKKGMLIAQGNHNALFESSEDYRRIFGKKLDSIKEGVS